MIAGVRLPVLAILLLLPSSAFALTPAEFAGRWSVTWDNSSKNNMTLAVSGERFSGTYTNDAGASCSVTGNFLAAAATAAVAFQIVCPLWDIRMDGRSTADGKSINGSYRAYVDGSGPFSMVKQ
jgi:hypothetical protein